LLANSESAGPKLTASGKVAGAGPHSVTESYKIAEQESVTRRIFEGSLGIQVARTFVYTLVFLLGIIGLNFIFKLPLELLDRKHEIVNRAGRVETSSVPTFSVESLAS
jgi:hypothetical protein